MDTLDHCEQKTVFARPNFVSFILATNSTKPVWVFYELVVVER